MDTHGITDAQRAITLFYPRLLARLERMLGRSDVAEDVAQEVCLKAHVSPPDPRFMEAILYRTAYTTAIDRIRRESVRCRKGSAVPPANSPSAEEHVMSEELSEKFREVVTELHPSLHEVFVLRYVEEMPREEVASRLNISLKALEQRTTRARAFIQKRLRALCGGSPL
jgi:RNA polymerase sigma factor (sigma-70 family)